MAYRIPQQTSDENRRVRSVTLFELKPEPLRSQKEYWWLLAYLVCSPILMRLALRTSTVFFLYMLATTISACVWLWFAQISYRLVLVRDKGGRAVVFSRSRLFWSSTIRFPTEGIPTLYLRTTEPAVLFGLVERTSVMMRLPEGRDIELVSLTMREQKYKKKWEGLCSGSFHKFEEQLPGKFYFEQQQRDAANEIKKRTQEFSKLFEAAVEIDDGSKVTELLHDGLPHDLRIDDDSLLSCAARYGAVRCANVLLAEGHQADIGALASCCYGCPGDPDEDPNRLYVSMLELLIQHGATFSKWDSERHGKFSEVIEDTYEEFQVSVGCVVENEARRSEKSASVDGGF